MSLRFHRRSALATGSHRVAQFRGEKSRSPLPPAEKRLLAVLGVHLCFLPWALGTMHPWSQWTSLGLAAIGFCVALAPRGQEAEAGWSAGPFRTAMTPRLWRFPIFWLGLALLLYIAIQALNPSWRYQQNEEIWWLVRLPDISWLPTSVEVPFGRFNAWRQLVIYGSAWLVVCSAWVGITRRRSIRILLVVVMLNAVALSCFLVLQRVVEGLRFPGPFSMLTKQNMTTSFIYRNHGGAYLALTTFSAVVLAIWGYDRGVRTMKKSTPTVVLMLVALALAGAVLFTVSRSAILSLAAASFGFGLWLFLRWRHRPADAGTNYRVTVAVAVILGGFLVYVGRNLDFSSIHSRFGALVNTQLVDESISSRRQARSAALSMLSDHWLRGVGAGGFRHRFPRYVRQYPDIDHGGELFWEHAHNDWLEIPIELGLVGTSVLLAGAGCVIGALVRARHQWHNTMVPLLFGCLATLLHAWIDFPFQCPAILVTWCLMLTLALRGVQIQGARG